MSPFRRYPLAAAAVLAVFAAPNAMAQSATPRESAKSSPLPAAIEQIMAKPRYQHATWSLLVVDLKTGESFYEKNADRLSLTGSTRKLFSVGLALHALGSDHRQTTTVHRQGKLDPGGVLSGDLVLVAGGDLAFGGRRLKNDIVEFTNFDHNDANGLGTAILTPQDPLYALDRLAAQVRASGVTKVSGEVVVDDRMFEAYRVPNGNLLITPMMLNENQIDVSITPTAPGQSAKLVYRPITGFFQVLNQVVTGAADSESRVEFSGHHLTSGVGQDGVVDGEIPLNYRAPMSEADNLVGTFRVEDPNAFARTAFIEALGRQGVIISAPAVAENPIAYRPTAYRYESSTLLAEFRSAPLAQSAQLVLKVSLNLGANLCLSLFGLEKGERTIAGALRAERETLITEFGIDGEQFLFPSNGSGTPDSQAAPAALVKMLVNMSRTPVAKAYKNALPILGRDGSLAVVGRDLPAQGHVFAKPGTTVMPGADGQTLELKAQCLAGYIDTRGGREVAYALMVNDAGPVIDIEVDVVSVFADEAAISSIIYESL